MKLQSPPFRVAVLSSPAYLHPNALCNALAAAGYEIEDPRGKSLGAQPIQTEAVLVWSRATPSGYFRLGTALAHGIDAAVVLPEEPSRWADLPDVSLFGSIEAALSWLAGVRERRDAALANPPRGLYRHFKHRNDPWPQGAYAVNELAQDCELPGRRVVVYRSLETGQLWARPLANFMGTVIRPELGYAGLRFLPVPFPPGVR